MLVTGAPPVRGGGGMPQRIITVSRSLFSLRITGAGQSGNTPGIGGRLPTHPLITPNRARIPHAPSRQNPHDTHWHCYYVRWLGPSSTPPPFFELRFSLRPFAAQLPG